jgi:hypothetical protein
LLGEQTELVLQVVVPEHQVRVVAELREEIERIFIQRRTDARSRIPRQL